MLVCTGQAAFTAYTFLKEKVKIEKYLCQTTDALFKPTNRLATTPHPFTREVYQRIEAVDVQKAYEQFNPKTIELKPRRQVGFSA